jgi:endo-beta-N-acetylglucosaminidase D
MIVSIHYWGRELLAPIMVCQSRYPAGVIAAPALVVEKAFRSNGVPVGSRSWFPPDNAKARSGLEKKSIKKCASSRGPGR